MEPKFSDGDIVIIDPAVEPDPGDFVVAERELDNEVTFKKYKPKTFVNKMFVFELVALNEDYPTYTINENDPAIIVGTMVEHRSYRSRDR